MESRYFSTDPSSPTADPWTSRRKVMPCCSASQMGIAVRSAPLSTAKRMSTKSPYLLRTWRVTSGLGQSMEPTRPGESLILIFIGVGSENLTDFVVQRPGEVENHAAAFFPTQSVQGLAKFVTVHPSGGDNDHSLGCTHISHILAAEEVLQFHLLLGFLA